MIYSSPVPSRTVRSTAALSGIVIFILLGIPRMNSLFAAAPPVAAPASSAPPAPSTAPSPSSPSTSPSRGASLGIVRPVPVYKKSMIAVPFFAVAKDIRLETESLSRVIRRDLELSGYFTVLDSQTANRQNLVDVERQQVDWARWTGMGVEHYLMGSCKSGPTAGSLEVEILLYDIQSRQRVFGKAFSGSVAEYRGVAHQISDEVVRYLKNISPGIARTRIVYITDRTGQRLKELAIMDYDGYGQNAAPLTRHGRLCVAPCWGANGKEIYFTSYRDYNPDLYGITVDGKSEWHISRQSGLNTLPAWSPTLQKICMVLAKDGNPELYTCNRSGGGLSRLTKTKTIESSPCWSPDGSQIAFCSDRESGHPQLFVMNADGSGARRLTRQGGWNDAPAWSPKGDKIAFVSRIDGKFDIFTCAPSGENSTWKRLTMNAGDNETPTWAPDGRHLAFASNRTGAWQIYLMLDDGSNQQQLTTIGSNQQPAWSPAPPEGK